MDIIHQIKENVIQGRRNKDDEGLDDSRRGESGVAELVSEAIRDGTDIKAILTEGLSEGMKVVGERYETGEYFIPDMLAAAEAVTTAMEIMEPHLVKAGVKPKGKMVLATVQGDLHDIGKNIVALILRGAGFEVIDLGCDVPSGRIVTSVQKEGANLVGLSALLTTTMRVMKEVVDKLEEAGLRSQVKVLIGGAPTSPEFARDIGADAHGKDAFQAVEIAEELSKGA